LLAAGRPATAQSTPTQRSITVVGEAQVKVTPDRVVLTIGVETSDAKLIDAKALHDKRIQSVLAATRAARIDPRDIHTDYLQIEPTFNFDSGARWQRVNAFAIRQSIEVTVRDVSRYEQLLTELLAAGVTHVHNVSLQTAKLRKNRDTARSM